MEIYARTHTQLISNIYDLMKNVVDNFEDCKCLENCKLLVRVFTMQQCAKEDLPSFLTVQVRQEEYELLVSVTGWKPVCFKCKEVRHVRAKCTQKKETRVQVEKKKDKMALVVQKRK